MPIGAVPRQGANTDLVMSGTGPGQSVSGAIAPVGDTTFNPLNGYPSAPPAGFETLNEGFAGVIHGTTVPGGQQLLLYCIDIRTLTYQGLGYVNGSWDASNVPNVGFVAYILQYYFPHTPNPPAPDNSVRAAAVQAAIWFLTDKYVLNADDPIRPLTEGIVADAIANGPLNEPQPSLTITPGTASGAAGTPVGPYTVNGDAGVAVTLASTGGTMYSDAQGTIPIAQQATVPVGQQVWLRASSPGASTVTLNARGTATVPTGGVFLYDNNTPNVADAQRLILAADATVTLTATAQAQFHDSGTLVVTKMIAGPGAGQQGPVTITVTCNGVARPPFVIPADATGTSTHTYTGIPTPATCTLTETVDGTNPALSSVVVGSPQTVTLPDNDTPDDPTSAQPVVDTYTLNPGSLLVTKSITGPAAGQQGPVQLVVTCSDGTSRQFTIPAAAASAPVFRIEPLPAGTTCRVIETADGSTDTADVVVTLPPGAATVPAGGAAILAVTDTYTATPTTPPTTTSPAPIPEPTPEPQPAPELPDTGASSLVPLLGAGVVCILGGLALLLAVRRRHQ